MVSKPELLNVLTQAELRSVAIEHGIEVPEGRSKVDLAQELAGLTRVGVCALVRDLEPERCKELGVDVLRLDPGQLVAALREEEFRKLVFELPGESVRDQPLLPHQQAVVSAVERNGGASGIVHLPTGAGKTRIGLELVARRLHANPNDRVIWVSYPTVLIRQGMLRLAEMAAVFPKGTRIQWAESRPEDPDLLTRAHVTFMMRDDLKRVLRLAADPDADGPLQNTLRPRGRSRVTVIYDECHQLGAPRLQVAWRGFDKKFLSGISKPRERFQTIGLSATALPTDVDSHKLLRERIFPISGSTSAKPAWGVLVHASLTNRELTRARILCPINRRFLNDGPFTIPKDIMARATARLRRPDQTGPRVRPAARELQEFSTAFNGKVMQDPAVLSFLAGQIGSRLHELGKTLVFVPTIKAANELTQYLKNHPSVGPGKVTLAHSRLDEFAESDPEDSEDEEPEDRSLSDDDADGDAGFADVQRQINAFIARGSEPCVMVNVGMLTTGFDDPSIQTVILARLTFSENLLWQMVGRGLRGPEVRGTEDCYVIDPIHLAGRFEHLEEYRPQLDRGDGDDISVDREEDPTAPLDPSVPLVSDAPVLDAEPAISPTLHEDVTTALRAFLASGADASGHLFFENTIRKTEDNLRSRLGQPAIDLTWLRARIPTVLSDVNVRSYAEEIDFVAHYRITSDEEYRSKVGALLRAAIQSAEAPGGG